MNCQIIINVERDNIAKFPGSYLDAFIFLNSTFKQTLEYDPNAGFLFADSGYGLSPVINTLHIQPTTPEDICFYKIHRKIRSDMG